MKKLFFFLALFTLLLQGLQAGVIRGSVIDDHTGESLPFVNILVSETGSGTTTDLDGNFTVSLKQGTFTIVFSYIGYADYIISGVDSRTDQPVSLGSIRMKEEGKVLQEVVVTATQIRNTESALSTIKRKSINVMDGISSQTFSRMGDSNAGEAIKRVTGVSVEDGKNVYVRGLGDRYTKTLLNGMTIPGLDPDRNTVQIDIFPTNVIDNILIYKSFMANLNGDFSGGIVDLVTKDFPDERNFSISASAGYNPKMNLRNDFLTSQGGSKDWLGYDDGTRALPFDKSISLPDETANDPVLYQFTKLLPKSLAAIESKSGINSSFSLAGGNQRNIGKVTLGYTASLYYKNEYKHYDDAEYGAFVAQEVNDYQLTRDKITMGSLSSYNVLLSGFKLLRINNGEDNASKLSIVDTEDNPSTIHRDVLHYTQRALTTLNVNGDHLLGGGNFEIEWSVAPSLAQVDEPDIRSAGFELTDQGTLLLKPAVGADVTRAYRYLTEKMINSKIDFIYNFTQWSGEKARIKVGLNDLRKERDYEILSYLIRVNKQSDLNINGNPDNILKEENLWKPESDRTGAFLKGNYEPGNTFHAQQTTLAGYAMTELPITHNIKAVLGLRAEKTDIYYTGQNNLGDKVFDNEKILNDLDILPSSNLIFAIHDKMNIRASYNRTLARPSFKEKSLAQIQDPVSGRTFIGNTELKSSRIDNIDLRWERFASRGQLISFSVFYKNFKDPIELESYDELSPDNYTPRNHDNATVYGFELEAMKNLDFLGGFLSNFFVGANASYIQSEIKRSANVGLYGNDTRTMVGQSPYLVNGNIGYRSQENQLEFSIAYNVQGPRMTIVGIGANPDVYEAAFHALDAKLSYKFGPSNMFKLSISAGNLLNSEKVFSYDGGTINSGEFIWSKLSPGRTFGIGLSANFK